MALVWLSGLRLRVELSGPEGAPVLVLVHGLGLDLRVWDALMPHLSGFRVLRLDQRGHGGSDAPAPPYALGTLIRDAEAVMDHLRLSDAVLVAGGEGGLVAQGLAVKRLDLVRGLGLTGAATRLGNPDAWAARIATLTRVGPDLAAEARARLAPREAASAPLVEAMLASTRPEGWLGHSAAMATADLYQTTATLRLPVLVLAGGEDRRVPPDMQRELADLVPGAAMQILHGAGHLPMLTAPDRLAGALLPFLARIGHGQAQV